MALISLDEATANWAVDGIWKIAPAGLDWIKEGDYVVLGNGVVLGDSARLGDYVRLGDYARLGDSVVLGDESTDAIDLGWADGFRKCICQVGGVAYIGDGCRWFTLDEALKHWSNKPERETTMCLMMAALHIAMLRGWKTGSEA